VWQDMVRQCRKYGLRWRQPSTFPRLGVLPLRIALLGVDQPWIGAFCRRVMELNFVLDEDINRADRLVPILTELGLPASDILDQAQVEPTKTRLREQTEQARARGIFGAPSFFVDAEMFWGNDRLGRRSAVCIGTGAAPARIRCVRSLAWLLYRFRIVRMCCKRERPQNHRPSRLRGQRCCQAANSGTTRHQ
jgi:hypothetical protein